MLDSNVACCVETLCNKGCKAVRDDIAALESGQGLPETRELRAEEVRAVLAELKSIMAVYGDVLSLPELKHDSRAGAGRDLRPARFPIPGPIS